MESDALLSRMARGLMLGLVLTSSTFTFCVSERQTSGETAGYVQAHLSLY